LNGIIYMIAENFSTGIKKNSGNDLKKIFAGVY